ncbi:hypothetical protein ACFV1U_16490 [Streptomyces microflavus]|uniref:hypothetical protein n=1 Tax=Streptomyces microflavus TaxID=1919 RepID=UPI0036C62071
MARINEDTKRRNREAIREAMGRLLAGDLPAGGKCDLKTLAAMAGVNRTAFYPKKDRDGTVRPSPYQHLAEEFERRLQALQEAGEVVDPRVAQIERLKSQVAALNERVARRDAELADLAAFKTLAVSRLAAQHDEITRLREQSQAAGNLHRLSISRKGTAPFGA